MPDWIQAAYEWLAAVRADLYAITVLMAVAWAASEVVVGYPDRPVRALCTAGAWVLMLANALFACVVLAAALVLIPGSASAWMALSVGLSWQAMLRGGINIQPLPPSSTAGAPEGLGVPLNELYSRLQGFCVGQIQRALVGERFKLMEKTITELDIPDLARIARLVTAAQAMPEAGAYVDKIEKDETHTAEQREILLISLILDNNGADILHKRVKETGRRKRG